VVFFPRDTGSPQYVDRGNPIYDSLAYVVMWPRGTFGWSRPRKGETGGTTPARYYSYRLMRREGDSMLPFVMGSLLEQFLVDCAVLVESNNLNFLRQNQKALKVGCPV